MIYGEHFFPIMPRAIELCKHIPGGIVEKNPSISQLNQNQCIRKSEKVKIFEFYGLIMALELHAAFFFYKASARQWHMALWGKCYI